MAAITLSQNLIYTGLTNVILNLKVQPSNLDGYDKFAQLFKITVSPYAMYHRIIDTDVVSTYDFNKVVNNNNNPHNLLETNFPGTKEQAVKLNRSRQVCVSIEQFKGKPALGDVGTFETYCEALKKWLDDSMVFYIGTLVNLYIGTNTANGSATVHSKAVTIPSASEDDTVVAGTSVESLRRLAVSAIGKALEELKVAMAQPSTDYTANGFLKTHKNPIIVWNAKYARICKAALSGSNEARDLPFDFEYVLPAKYFGTVIAASASNVTGDGTKRTLVDITNSASKLIKAGEVIPSGTTIAGRIASEDADNQTGYDPTAYTPIGSDNDTIAQSDVICKVMDPDFVIFLEGAKETTSFVNPQSGITNYWLRNLHGIATNNAAACVTVTVA